MKEQWNERYSGEAYVYGQEPNTWLKEQLLAMQACRILFPAEGEGRNAVFAAGLGFDVTAFDFSETARKKALELAQHREVKIRYDIAAFEEAGSLYLPASFDLIALIYAHMHSSVRRSYHQKLLDLLKPGGILLLEAFSLEQLPLTSGGPKNTELLYRVEDIREDFASLSECQVIRETISLDEGTLHQGIAHVIRVIGRKYETH